LNAGAVTAARCFQRREELILSLRLLLPFGRGQSGLGRVQHVIVGVVGSQRDARFQVHRSKDAGQQRQRGLLSASLDPRHGRLRNAGQ